MYFERTPQALPSPDHPSPRSSLPGIHLSNFTWYFIHTPLSIKTIQNCLMVCLGFAVGVFEVSLRFENEILCCREHYNVGVDNVA